MTVRRAVGIAGVALLLVGIATAMAEQPRAADSDAQPVKVPAEQPNVLIIQTDDQRATGTFGVMPATRRLFIDEGTRYTSAFATPPLCCPSRTSLLTGQYAHNQRCHE
jgi:N-acetylglucosamine-6-sulfatase